MGPGFFSPDVALAAGGSNTLRRASMGPGFVSPDVPTTNVGSKMIV